MAQHSAGTITANGVSVPIFVTDQGDWTAAHAGRELRYESREKLEAAIKRLTKTTTTPVAVDFVRIEKRGDQGIVRTRGTATGIHSGNGNVLVVWHTRHGGDQKDQTKPAGGWHSTTADFGDVSDEVLAEYRDLVIAKAQAEAAERAFVDKHKIDLKDEVLKAIKGAAESE